jgi:L-asparaginase/Glu-tRNA(Gln) amidotransferase subunit D
VTKLDAFADEAFGSPHETPLGTAVGGAPRFSRPPDPDRRLLLASDLKPRVAVVPLVLGDDGTWSISP